MSGDRSSEKISPTQRPLRGTFRCKGGARRSDQRRGTWHNLVPVRGRVCRVLPLGPHVTPRSTWESLLDCAKDTRPSQATGRFGRAMPGNLHGC
eukprot:1124334-Pleurochrysis_carterae.AAC.1